MSEARYELPDGWRWETLSDACEINPRMSWPESLGQESLVSFVPMAAVDDVSGAIVRAEPRPLGEVWKGYKRFRDGDVIFARITPCMENGKAAIASNLANGIGLGSTEFHVLRPRKGTLAEWIYRFVRQQSFRNDAAHAMTGTAGQLRVPESYLSQVSLPLPQPDEQRRIVERIEVLFEQSRSAREALQRIPALLRQFRQAVLSKAFRGELTERDPNDEPAVVLVERIRAERNARSSKTKHSDSEPHEVGDFSELPDGWMWTRFEDLLEELKNGIFSEAPAYEPPGIPILRISAVRPLSVTLDSPRYLRDDLDRVAAYQLLDGDLLFTRYNGSLNLVGACGLVRGVTAPMLYPDKLIRARVNRERVQPDYLELYFASRAPRDIIEGKAKSTAGQQGISGKDLKSVPVALAPLHEQERIVVRVRALFAQADAIERAIVAAQRRAERVDQAILARAFRGEL